MKLASTNALYPNDVVAKRVVEYSAEHSLPLPAHITDLHAQVEKTHARADYMISNNQAQCNICLAKLINAKRVLEIGTFLGYSALVWAHAVGQEGTVTTLEFSEEYANEARELFKKNGVDNVEVLQGDAIDTMASLSPEEPYDLIFIDANKSGYPAYLQQILDASPPGANPSAAPQPRQRLLRVGGLIVADNLLRRGLVADESSDNPYSTQGEKKREKSEYETDHDLVKLREYNDAAAKNPRLETVLLPIFDGVGLTRLLD